MSTALVFILVLAIPACLGNPKPKKPLVPLFGLHGMRYIPLVPYNFLGLNPVLLQGSGLRPRPAVVKEKSPEVPAPYVPQYGDMEKLVGYGGLPMPYGGYGYPFLYGYSGDVKK